MMIDPRVGEAGLFHRAKLNENVNRLIGSPGSGAGFVSTGRDSILDALRERLAGGEINKSAYDAGWSALERQVGGARREARSLMEGIRESGKLSIQDILREARDDLRTPEERREAKTPFDFDPYQTRLQEAAQKYQAGLPKQIRQTFGDKSFFDMDKIQEAVTRGYGMRNAPTDKLLEAVAEQRRRADINYRL